MHLSGIQTHLEFDASTTKYSLLDNKLLITVCMQASFIFVAFFILT